MLLVRVPPISAHANPSAECGLELPLLMAGGWRSEHGVTPDAYPLRVYITVIVVG